MLEKQTGGAVAQLGECLTGSQEVVGSIPSSSTKIFLHANLFDENSMKFDEIDYDKVKTYSIKDRKSKVNAADFAKPHISGGSFSQFMDSLPNILAAGNLRKVIDKVVEAKSNGSIVVFAMGAHTIKTGLNPIIIDLVERGIVDAIALNGAGIIHDSELAMTGQTSEDVAASLKTGNFGMARETADFLNGALNDCASTDTGLGGIIGDAINSSDMPHKSLSVIAAARRADIPLTVHIAIGTDIIHIHPKFPAKLFAAASLGDFRIFSSVIAKLAGGVYFNIGSAVILPEVFLKAVSLVSNLGHDLTDFTAVNMDFIQHYRPVTNVVRRPTKGGGTGYTLTGHHEIMIPLLSAGIIEKMGD